MINNRSWKKPRVTFFQVNKINGNLLESSVAKKGIEHKTLFKLSLASFLLAFLVVFLGAFTRLVDAGLGCPDWPGCYGHLLWPDEAEEIAKAEAAFSETPVEIDKTWPEMVHRYFAGTLGIMILAIVIMAVRRSRRVNHPQQKIPVKLSLLLLAMVILQAAFGMWTVTLKLWPQVVTAHLLGGFTTLSLLWLLVQRLSSAHWQLTAAQLSRLDKTKPLLWIALAVIIVQITLGGWVSANYAALACPDLPQCFGSWLPPADFSAGFNIFQAIGPNYLGGQLDNHARTAIQLSHRIGAVIVVLTLIITAVQLWRIKARSIRFWVLVMSGVLAIQVTLGISNVLLVLPLSVAVGHNAVGAVLLLTQITLLYRSYTAQLTRRNQKPLSVGLR